MVTISDRIKEGMRIRGLKQVDIIERTGINKGALSSYISGRYSPKQTNIHLISKALNVSEAWLMGYDVPMERSIDDDNYVDELSDVDTGGLTNKEKELVVLFRKAGNIPEDEAEALKKQFESTIDIYLKAKGIKIDEDDK